MKPNETERNGMKSHEAKAAEFAEIVAQLDKTEQLIVMAGVQALALGAFDFPAYEAWVQERIDRHRAGEELMVSDLETPPHPNAESAETTAGLCCR